MNAKDIARAVALLLALDKHGVNTIAEARVLFAAAELETPSVRDLSAATGLPFTSVSRIGWKLVKGGWFRYEADGGDRRKRLVRVNLARLA